MFVCLFVCFVQDQFPSVEGQLRTLILMSLFQPEIFQTDLQANSMPQTERLPVRFPQGLILVSDIDLTFPLYIPRLRIESLVFTSYYMNLEVSHSIPSAPLFINFRLRFPDCLHIVIFANTKIGVEYNFIYFLKYYLYYYYYITPFLFPS